METDYLVVGAGAMAMAFVDVMLRESDATFTIVDRRHAAGGHWNDAYPFVRLHQPSAYYGVPSKPLGRDRKDTSGFNQGYYELASGVEVAHYFHALMDEDFLPSGRVRFLPLTDYVGGGEVRSMLSGRRETIAVRKKLVDARMFDTMIPLTHERTFAVADDAVCIPPNHLTRLAANHDHYVVLGAGKTAIDSICWLLANGAPDSAITWVAPRDPWLWSRAFMQPGPEFFDRSIGGVAAQYEVLAAAKSVREICEGMEAAGVWLRVDKTVWPSMFHGPTVSEREVEAVRRVGQIVRMGRVQGIQNGKIVLDQGEAAVPKGALFIDCTARGLANNVGSSTPVFASKQISLQMIRLLQPTFSAALIGFLEAAIESEAEKQSLSRVVSMTDTAEDYPRRQLDSLANQLAWSRHPQVRQWLSTCRLDGLSRTAAMAAPDDAPKQAILQRLRAATGPAMENLQRLTASAPAMARAG